MLMKLDCELIVDNVSKWLQISQMCRKNKNLWNKIYTTDVELESRFFFSFFFVARVKIRNLPFQVHFRWLEHLWNLQESQQRQVYVTINHKYSVN